MRLQTFLKLVELCHIMVFFFVPNSSFALLKQKPLSDLLRKDFSCVRRSASCTCTDGTCHYGSKLINAHLPKEKLQYPSLANTPLILAETISFYLQMLFLKSLMLSLYG